MPKEAEPFQEALQAAWDKPVHISRGEAIHAVFSGIVNGLVVAAAMAETHSGLVLPAFEVLVGQIPDLISGLHSFALINTTAGCMAARSYIRETHIYNWSLTALDQAKEGLAMGVELGRKLQALTTIKSPIDRDDFPFSRN
jgi:hypothetical protein